MKRIFSILLGLSLGIGTTAVFVRAQFEPPPDVPKVEKKKVDKSKSTASDKSQKGGDKDKGKGKSQKRKAEQPKSQ